MATMMIICAHFSHAFHSHDVNNCEGLPLVLSFLKMEELNLMFGSKEKKSSLDLPSFLISGGVLILFVIIALINADFVAGTVDYLFGISATYFGLVYQIVLLGTFLISLIIVFSK